MQRSLNGKYTLCLYEAESKEQHIVIDDQFHVEQCNGLKCLALSSLEQGVFQCHLLIEKGSPSWRARTLP